MKSKINYSVNKDNQLLVKSSIRETPLKVNGKFAIDRDNKLIFLLNEPAHWRRKYGLANKIRFQGQWRLNPNYDLEFVVSKTNGYPDKGLLTLAGEIISTERDSLVFEITSRDTRHDTVCVQILRFCGFWQADEYNQLSFNIKDDTARGILTLEGAWQVNKNQLVTYKYEKINLKTKARRYCLLTFQGYWQINTRNKLTYILSRSNDSRFDFRAQLESPSIYPKEGRIRYRIGVGLSKTARSKPQTLILYGTWKINRDLNLSFEMDYGNGRITAIEFTTGLLFNSKNELTFSLKGKTGQPLGITVTFTHRFLSQLNAEAFMRLKGSRQEKRADIGIRLPF